MALGEFSVQVSLKLMLTPELRSAEKSPFDNAGRESFGAVVTCPKSPRSRVGIVSKSAERVSGFVSMM